ncbi:MBL fold metallo-hydrolase [Caldivirga sp.]|uniref:MBL fold metallo-hydrolase n=1 Tax=Caldivirga sp. TaxID=2080243 RepID=UPI0025B95B13|nr:MBL fold metallo-hydrolase [Caldivirga sp.]
MISVIRRFGGIEVSCCGHSILVDPTRRFIDNYDAVLITHGHSDHYTSHVSKARRVIMSGETLRILREFRGLRLGAGVTVAYPNKPIIFDDFSVIPLNAGHVMGSLMYLIEFKHGSVLLTGDMNVEDSIILKGAEPYPDVDILVIESTYGDPSFHFEPRDNVYNDILDLAERTIMKGLKLVLSGFALGKGQELYKLLINNGFNVAMDKNVHSLNSILLNISTLHNDSDIIVADIPPRIKSVNDSVIALVTGGAPGGWIRKHVHIQLSSHSDFNGLVDFAVNSRAKRIYTIYGHSEKLARHLRLEHGLNSYPIPNNTLI